MKKKFYFLVFGAVLFSIFYWSTHSQKGFRQTWGKLLESVPGKFEWEKIEFDFLRQKIHLDHFRYFHSNGKQIVSVDKLNLKLGWSSLYRLKLIVQNLEVEGVVVDLSILPPEKKKTEHSFIIETLSRRLAVDHSHLKNIKFELKGAELEIPNFQLKYVPSWLKENHLEFSANGLKGKVVNRFFGVEKLFYSGDFSVPDRIKEIFLFRQAKGKMTLQGGYFDRFRLSDLTTEASFNGEEIRFSNLELTFGKFVYPLQLRFSPFAQTAVGQLKTVGWVPFTEIPGIVPRISRVFEKVQFKLDFDLAGFVPQEMNGTVSIQVQASGNQINPKNQEAKLQILSVIKQGRFDFKQFLIQSSQGEIAGKGFLDLVKMQLQMAFTAKELDLRTLLAFFSDIELYGSATLSGEISGNLKSPDFVFKGKTTDAGYKFLRFAENEGSFEILNGQMKYVGQTPTGSKYVGNVEVRTAYIFDGTRRSTHLKTSFSDLEAGMLLENPDAFGKIGGVYEMEIAGPKMNGKLKAQIKGFKFLPFFLGDMEVEGELLDRKFTFPKITFHPPKIDQMLVPSPVLFQFDDKGFVLKGSPMVGMEIDGKYVYDDRRVLQLSAKCSGCDTVPFTAALDYPPVKGKIDGKSTMDIVIGNFPNSKINAQIDRLEVPLGEGVLKQAETLKISYHQGAFYFDSVPLLVNQQGLKIGGSYSTVDKKNPFNLQLKGVLDLILLKAYPEYIRDAGGPAEVDLNVRGTTESPQFFGKIGLKGSFLTPRSFGTTLENLKGTFEMENDKVTFNDFEATVQDGNIRLSGPLWLKNFEIQKADLRMEAREIAVSSPGTYKIYLSGKASLTGAAPALLLAGNIDITEGRYIKNFDLREYVLTPAAVPRAAEPAAGTFSNLKLDLRIKSPGELLIKNNVAEIYLKTDLKVGGTSQKPVFEGALQVLEGQIQYFKLKFENAKGVVDFRNPEKGQPYVDISGEHLFERPSETIRVIVHVEGFADNLKISFNSDPALEKREILALIFTGALPEEGRKISGLNLASSILASQITSVIEGPVTSLTGLDVFRLEASDPDSKSLTSLVVGKKLTDRLTLEFKTDLGIDESVRSIQAEYLLFDNVLFKASRSTRGRYKLDLTLRFSSY